MNVTFYFDPACPFCWITSRWLTSVAKKRDLKINWQPFSLAIKNDVLGKNNSQHPHAKGYLASHRIIRIIEAAHRQENADKGKLYADFGKLHHVGGENYDDLAIDTILALNSLPEGLRQAADDTSLDEGIKASIDEALSLTGQDVGVPIIAFNQADGKAGYFGPVLQSLPNEEDSLKLWDGLSQMATVAEFYELKRTRPKGGPDTGSTSGQFDQVAC